MDVEIISEKIECSDLKKCGEIATLLSVGKPEFFLNCGFCEYTFLQLDNFIAHMHEDHITEFPRSELKQETTEENEISNEQMCTTDTLESVAQDEYLKDFERVEIELDTSEANILNDIKEDLSNEFSEEENESETTLTRRTQKNQNFQPSSNRDDEIESSEEDYKPPKEVSMTKKPSKNSRYKQFAIKEKYKLNRNEEIENSEEDYNAPKEHSMAKRPSKTSHDRQNGIREKHKLNKDELESQRDFEMEISEEVIDTKKYPNKSSQHEVSRRRGLDDVQVSSNYGESDDDNFLQDFDESEDVDEPQPKSATPLIDKTKTNIFIALEDSQYQLLAEIYEKHTCFWDEKDIAYRFKNRREEALKYLHAEFNDITELNLTIAEFETHILHLRKICSTQKKKKIVCERKNMKFKSKCSFYKHITYLEVDVPPFECSKCKKLLRSIGQFKVHFAAHDGSLPFVCHICGHGFQLASNLTVHLRRHVQDFTYICEECDKPCATSTELKIHMRSHTGEKPFVCYICGQKTRTSSQLLVHILRHEKRPRHKCQLCPKTFYETGTLNEHMSIHRNIRDEICEVCDKGFINRKQLRQHQLIHNSEKKYSCKFCGKRFAQYAGLSGHMKTHGTKLSAIISEDLTPS